MVNFDIMLLSDVICVRVREWESSKTLEIAEFYESKDWECEPPEQGAEGIQKGYVTKVLNLSSFV